MSMSLQDEALAEYLGELDESLERLGVMLAKLEREGFDRESMRTIARDVHTVKGSSQLFGFNHIGEIAHGMEYCLERLQDASQSLLPELIQKLYAGLDFIAKSLVQVREHRVDGVLTEAGRMLLHDLEELAQQGKNAALSTPRGPGDGAPSKSESKFSPDEGSSDTIRVNVEILDNLMNLVGELVLIRNQILQSSQNSEDESLFKVSQHLNVVTSELQNHVMKTRMQPIGNIMNKFHRVVRDTARQLGKDINLQLEGNEIELDKTLIEAVRDPLTHIVRNAIDHGFESPRERLEAGKPEAGTLHVRSFHESGHVVIEIADDGRGLDIKKIVSKAIERGLATAEALAKMAEREIFQFIFQPGFSTADKVTNISGRGVGMDVVKTNIERIGGTIVLESNPGKGTQIKLRIPLTLAIIPALTVTADGMCFAIPQVKLVELLRISKDVTGNKGIEFLGGQPVFRLRGRILPLISLRRILSGEAGNESLSAMFEDAAEINIAVVNADRLNFGLIVDTMEDSADIVVKPISNLLKDLGIYSGATIMGNGSIALTLDVLGIADRSGAHAEGAGQHNPLLAEQEEHGWNDSTAEYLLVELSSPGRLAIPLSLVSRLEEFAAADIQLSCEQRVIRYRESLLPLLDVRDVLNLPPADSTEQDNAKVSVVVVTRSGRSYGLEVKSIVDVISASSEVDSSLKDRDGILGSIIEGENVLVILDVLEIIAKAQGSGGNAQADLEQLRKNRAAHHVLIVDDGSFIRHHLSQLLGGAGYRVATRNDGKQALEYLTGKGLQSVSLVISDIEMPEMNGLELARRVRANAKLKGLPMFALSSRSTEADIKLGLEVGFNKYFGKLETDELLDALDRQLAIASSKEVQYAS